MSVEMKKRLSSLAWRAGAMGVAVVIDTVATSLVGLGLPNEVVVILGLVLGELSKHIRNKYAK